MLLCALFTVTRALPEEPASAPFAVTRAAPATVAATQKTVTIASAARPIAAERALRGRRPIVSRPFPSVGKTELTPRITTCKARRFAAGNESRTIFGAPARSSGDRQAIFV